MRFRGGTMNVSIVDGFSHFGQALRLYALVLLMALPLAAAGIAWESAHLEQLDIPAGWYLLIVAGVYWPIGALALSVPGAAAFFAVPLMIDKEMKRHGCVTGVLGGHAAQLPALPLSDPGPDGRVRHDGERVYLLLPFTLPLFPAGQVWPGSRRSSRTS